MESKIMAIYDNCDGDAEVLSEKVREYIVEFSAPILAQINSHPDMDRIVDVVALQLMVDGIKSAMSPIEHEGVRRFSELFGVISFKREVSS